MLNFFKRLLDPVVEIQVCNKEYESPELELVFLWFKKNGWEVSEDYWGLWGAQEVTIYKLSKNKIEAELLLETYMGAIIRVPKSNAVLFSEIKVGT